MALLTAAQIAAIASGAPVRQVWKIYVPWSAISTFWDTITIHDDDGAETCVTDPGRRKVTAYNVSMAKPGTLAAGTYSITCANDDGMFYKATSGNHFYSTTGTYQADPQECHLEHTLYVWSAGAWSELLQYRGRITGAEYRDIAGVDGPHGATVDINTEQLGVSELLRESWDYEDGDSIDTGVNVDL
jgi:hypothetical protein